MSSYIVFRMNTKNDYIDCAVIVTIVTTLAFKCLKNDIHYIQMHFLCFSGPSQLLDYVVFSDCMTGNR